MGGITKSLGGFLGTEEGPKANMGNKALGVINARNNAYYDPSVTEALKQYGSGNMSLQDALNSVGGSTENQQMFQDMLATSAPTGSRYATEQVQNNPILGSLFGQNGQLQQTNNDVTGLMNQGFKLQPQDVEAYGQASGNIARLFGQQEGNVANQLAARGLAAAPSGAAGVAYSGLAGNKNEQLAQSQMDIANARMQNTLQRLNSARSYAAQLGGLGENAIQQQYGRQAQGAQSAQNNLLQSSAAQQAQNNAQLQGQQFEQENKPFNIMDQAIMGSNKFASSFGSSLGNIAGGFAGGGMGGGAAGGGGDSSSGSSSNFRPATMKSY